MTAMKWNAENITMTIFFIGLIPATLHISGMITLSGATLFTSAIIFGLLAYIINWGK